MDFDLESLKEKMDDETFSIIEEKFKDLTGQRDQARNESINGRRGLKSEVATLQQQNATLLERLGVASFEDAETLEFDPRSMTDAAKQLESKVKRLERELGSATQERDALKTENFNTKKSIAVTKAIGAHQFIDPDLVENYVSSRLTLEGDDLFFKQDDGNLVSIQDGVSAFAKSRPNQIRATGAGGAGVRPNNARGGAGPKVMTRAEYSALPQKERVALSKDGVTLE